MSARRRRRNPSVGNSLGWIVLGVAGVVGYEIYRNGPAFMASIENWFKSLLPGSGPTSIGTEAYEGITGKSPCAPSVATGSIQMPDGSIVPANCYAMTMIPGTQVAEVVTQSGPVYVESGQVNAQGAYIATTDPPADACYTQALEKWCCND